MKLMDWSRLFSTATLLLSVGKQQVCGTLFQNTTWDLSDVFDSGSDPFNGYPPTLSETDGEIAYEYFKSCHPDPTCPTPPALQSLLTLLSNLGLLNGTGGRRRRLLRRQRLHKDEAFDWVYNGEMYSRDSHDPTSEPPTTDYTTSVSGTTATSSAPWTSGTVSSSTSTTTTTTPATTTTTTPTTTATTASTSTTTTTTTTTVKICGPDVGQWLVTEMNTNMNHPAIKTNRENSWAMWIPFFNLGWHGAFLVDFKNLVGAGCVWDYKASQKFTSQNCPRNCDKSVTLCGICFFYDVPGNIHYGWIGRAGRIRAWFLHDRADAAQAGGTDDPKDTAAIDIGIDMWDGNGQLCPKVIARQNKLAKMDCQTCSDIYQDSPTGSKCK